jgi:protein TonB
MQGALTLLGLPSGADTRDIRKAYARAVKKIDQENDPAAFQALREAYEQALRLANGETQTQQAATSPIQPALAAPPAEPPEPLARAAWAQCVASIQQSPEIDEQVWEHVLREALASDALVNHEARLWFEFLIATVIAQGWRPSHEWLLPAAANVFGWNEDPLRLTRFNQAGAIVRHALDALRLMSGLPRSESAVMRAAIARLRDPRPPTALDLEQYNHALMRLNQLFPVLIPVIVDAKVFQHWRAAKVAPPIIEEPEPRISAHTIYKILLGLLILAIVLFLTRPMLVPYLSRSPYDAELKLIGKHVEYRAKPTQHDILSVEYRVSIREGGGVADMQIKHQSGDADFDVAVANAISQTPVLPPSGRLYHRLNFSMLPPGFRMTPGGIYAISRLPSGTILLPD